MTPVQLAARTNLIRSGGADLIEMLGLGESETTTSQPNPTMGHPRSVIVRARKVA